MVSHFIAGLLSDGLVSFRFIFASLPLRDMCVWVYLWATKKPNLTAGLV